MAKIALRAPFPGTTSPGSLAETTPPEGKPMTDTAGDISGSPLKATSLSISLTADDLPATVAWYRDAVGFEVDQEFERDGETFAVRLRSGSVAVLITQDDGARGTDRMKGLGFSFRLTTQQHVDDVARRIRAHGFDLESEPFDARGARAFRVRDPSGFLLVISSE